MEKRYVAGTGVLVLEKITPVITALFSPLKLDGNYPGQGVAQITISAGDEHPSWSNIYANLPPLLEKLSLETRYLSEDDLVPALRLLAIHFRVEDEPVIQRIFDNDPLRGNLSLETLFHLAARFNDGHNLKALKLESAQWCTGPALFGFGGSGFFVSKLISTSGNTTHVLSLGQDLDAAIRSGDMDKGAERLADEVEKFLVGVSDPAVRKALHWRLADRLLASVQDFTRRS